MPTLETYDLVLAAVVPLVLLVIGWWVDLAIRRAVTAEQPRTDLRLIEGATFDQAAISRR